MYHAPILVQTWLFTKSAIDDIVKRAFRRQSLLQSASSGSSGSGDEFGVHRRDAQRRRMGRYRRILKFQSRHINRLRTRANASDIGVGGCLK